MYLGVLWLFAVVAVVTAEKWRWPEEKGRARAEATVRIDTKVRFIDGPDDKPHKDNEQRNTEIQSDEVPFKEPLDTEGFYNRPPGSGRYPVRVEAHSQPYRVDPKAVYPAYNSQYYPSDGTLDSLQYCKCVSTPECTPRGDSRKACGVGKFLCCYKRPNNPESQESEFFNEVDDERLSLYPGQQHFAGPFPYPPEDDFGNFDSGRRQVLVGPGGPSGVIGPRPQNRPVLVGPDGPTGIIGPAQDRPQKRPILVGPEGPTGIIGPAHNRPQNGPGVLVGPEGPTGIIGPAHNRNQNGPGVLVGPEGPTGIIGPAHNRDHNRPGVLVGPEGPTGIIGPANNRHQNRPDVLVGPEGPTGIIGPADNRPHNRPGVLVGPEGPTGLVGPPQYNQDFPHRDIGSSETAQRGVLVGPGGPTGIIGPGYGQRPVLVGPGGPTGIIGPGRTRNPGILVGPGGPTGTIGPGRPILVGPGGPTGMIGPRLYDYFG